MKHSIRICLVIAIIVVTSSLLIACSKTPKPTSKIADGRYSTSKLEQEEGTIFLYKNAIWLASSDGKDVARLINLPDYNEYSSITASDSHLCFIARHARNGKEFLFKSNLDGSQISAGVEIKQVLSQAITEKKMIGNYLYYSALQPLDWAKYNANKGKLDLQDKTRHCQYRIPLDTTTGEPEILLDKELTEEQFQAQPHPSITNETLDGAYIYGHYSLEPHHTFWQLAPDLKNRSKVLEDFNAFTIDMDRGAKDTHIYGSLKDGFVEVDIKTGKSRVIRQADLTFERGALFVYSDTIVLVNDNNYMRHKEFTAPEQRGLYFYDLVMNLQSFCKADATIGDVLPVANTKEAIIFSHDTVGNNASIPNFYYVNKSEMRASKTVSLVKSELTNLGE